MESKSYHHGNLRKELIEAGIKLINEVGHNNFSLRKVVKRIGVSPTACYNHFSDKEELIASMKDYVNKELEDLLIEASSVSSKYPVLEMGKAYVKFFAENPHYFPFIYDNDDYSINLTKDSFVGDYEPFKIFQGVSKTVMDKAGVPINEQCDNLVAMWAMVQGISSMTTMRGFHYEGDWGELTERILKNKMNIGC